MRPQHWIYTVPLRLRSLFRRARVERELANELQYHVDCRTDELIRGGMTAHEARLAALREIGGGLEQRKEECRDARKTRPLEDLVRDLTFGLRMLRKSPGFTAVVITALALGIGANTALFSLFHQVLIRKLPVANPDELVVLATQSPRWGQMTSFSYPMFRELRDRNEVLSGLFALAGVTLNVGDAAGSDKANGQFVSGEYFEQLGVRPILGRLLNRSDDRTPGAHPVAVLSHAYWQRRFGGDPAIIGREIALNGHPTTVIGITPPGFYGTDLSMNIDVRVPVMMTPVFRPEPAGRLEKTGYQWLRVMGRLKPGVSRAQAEAALAGLYRQTREHEIGEIGSGMSELAKTNMLAMRLTLLPGEQGSRQLQQGFDKALRLLLGITVIILVITCANLANMLLARNAAREQEIAMRLALGASRTRLARQWLTESALLAVLGGAAGVLVASWCQSALLSFMPEDQRTNLSASPDLYVLGFALVMSLITGVVFGLAPALQVSRSSLEQAQRGTSRVATGFRGGLVALQIALCVPLLIVAGLFLNSLRNTRLVPVGFDANNILVASINPGPNGYAGPRLHQFFTRVLEEIRALPGVDAAGLASTVVLSGNADKIVVAVEGYEPTPGEDRSPYMTTITPGYFVAMRLPIIAGRDSTTPTMQHLAPWASSMRRWRATTLAKPIRLAGNSARARIRRRTSRSSAS